MGLLKTALIAGGVLLGVGAVGGITAAVATRQNANAIGIETSDSSNSTAGMENTNTVESVLKSIQATDIVVKEGKMQKQQSDYYAFNLANKTLEISSTKTIPQGFSATVTVKENTTVADLNDGKLNVTIKVEQVSTSMTQETDLELSGFKKIDDSLKAFFDKKTTGTDEEKNETDSSYSLTLIPEKDKATNFISIEQLNEIPAVDNVQASQTPTNGLTAWLANSNKASIATKTRIEGKIKLASISKATDGTTIFELKASKKGELLKLVKTENDKTFEALIGSIKTTNLLASSIGVIPTKNNQEESEMFSKNLFERASKKEPENMTGFKVKQQSLFVPVAPTPERDGVSNDIRLSSYVVKATASESKIAIPLGLKVTFGSNDEATSYITTDSKQAKLLEDAGFSFHFYTRLLDGKDNKTATDLVATDITTGDHKLNAYLTTEKYTKPSDKPTLNTQRQDNAVVNNNFFVLGPLATNMQNGQSWETINWMSNTKARNYIVFADYSYIAANDSSDMNALNNKVLFTAQLTLINVQNEAKATE